MKKIVSLVLVLSLLAVMLTAVIPAGAEEETLSAEIKSAVLLSETADKPAEKISRAELETLVSEAKELANDEYYTASTRKELERVIPSAEKFLSDNEDVAEFDEEKTPALYAEANEIRQAVLNHTYILKPNEGFLVPLSEAIEKALKIEEEAFYLPQTYLEFRLAIVRAGELLRQGADADHDAVELAIAELEMTAGYLVSGGIITTDDDFKKLEGSSGIFYLANNITVSETVSEFDGILLGEGYTITAEAPLFDVFGTSKDVLCGIVNVNINAVGEEMDSLFGEAYGNAVVTQVKIKARRMYAPVLFSKGAKDSIISIDTVEVASDVFGKAALVGATSGDVEFYSVLFEGNVEEGSGLAVSADNAVVCATIVLGNMSAEGSVSGLIGKVSNELILADVYYSGKLISKSGKVNLFSSSEYTKVDNSYVGAWATDADGKEIKGSVDARTASSGKLSVTLNDLLGSVTNNSVKRFCQVIGKDSAPYLAIPKSDYTDTVVLGIDGRTYTNLHIQAEPNYKEPEPIVINTEGIEAAIKRAESLKEDKYTENSWSAVAFALKNAKAALEEKNFQSKVDVAKIKLNTAITHLVEREPEPEPVETEPGETINDCDFKALNALLREAARYKNKEKNYTAETWKPFASALDTAEKALGATTQPIVDIAAERLRVAMAGLMQTVETPPLFTSQAPKEDGCGSSIAGTAVVLAALVAVGVGFKKKEN